MAKQSHSEQEQRGEWTAESVKKLIGVSWWAGWWNTVADAHNAALAAERKHGMDDLCALTHATIDRLAKENEQLNKQLAAELGKPVTALEASHQTFNELVHENQQLREQLAAEREQGVKALAERSFELHECKKQLAAAEREKVQRKP